MLKIPVNTHHSKYGTFSSNDTIYFVCGSGTESHIYKFCAESANILHRVYPSSLSEDVDIKRKLAGKISRELYEFSPYLAVDISIVYDKENGFQIVLRDPENIGDTFLDRYNNQKRRSYIDAQLHLIAIFLLDKKAKAAQPAPRTTINQMI